ncbi:chemotaxis protein CheA [Halioxenophilus aromaticivorans]|uniref:Chemotaxis protein CheA n=1 Tax=Halioxenophilus aromaticivorans TaxID=1306992 RepID=A0AAV3U9F1_9ALTE
MSKDDLIGQVETFRIEAREHLATLEESLLELEESPEALHHVDQAFRAMHTIKGAGGMFGYHDLSQFTHYLESALDQLREGGLVLSSEFISLMLEAVDAIKSMIAEPAFTVDQNLLAQALLSRLRRLVPNLDEQQVEVEASSQAAGEGPAIYRVRFKPNQTTFTDGFDVVPILRELSALGECSVTTKTEAIPPLEQFESSNCYLAWDVVVTSCASRSDIEETFMFVEDDWSIGIEKIDLQDTSKESDQLGELLVSRGLVTPQQVDANLSDEQRLGKALSEQGLVKGSDVNAALKEQQATRQLKQALQHNKVEDTVRVPAARLDALMNLVGELVIVQARLSQYSHQHHDETIVSISEDLDLLSTELRDQTFSIRMLPIGTTFGRFRRLVRDLSNNLDKKIQLVTKGAETELDKMVIDKLSDPLVHLIRNSIDHGIETAAEREQLGKPECGTIQLVAEHSDSNVIIHIRDDGRGLNRDSIYAKALSKGLVTAQDILSDNEICQLIFEPGFSTAATVSDISGRGVGMDVVKRSIQELGGKIDLVSTQGEGTHLTIRLPMTLAIIEGLMVKVADEYYVLPLGLVEECIEYEKSSRTSARCQRLVTLRGAQVPCMHLREWFDVDGVNPTIEQIVITRIEQERFGFVVDEVVGQYQTVIKRLGKMYEGIIGFSGATILGDGSVAMILDPVALIEALEAPLNRVQPISLN